MKAFTLALLASTLVSAIELPEFTVEQYESGAVHESIMRAKHVRAQIESEGRHIANTLQASWDRQRADGEMDSSQYPALEAPVQCVDGLAIVEEGNPNQTFKCHNMDLLDFKSHFDLGSFAGEGSSSWGWVSPSGREFVSIGQADGTAFCEISPEGKLIYLGRLPQQSEFSIWREIRTYKNYVIIGSEAVGHGVQIFDWTKVRKALVPYKPVYHYELAL